MTNWARLSKLAGMLGSPHDGERVNAARLLEAALQREGLTFADFAQRIAGGGSAYTEQRTVIVEKWKPNPASALARKIISTCNKQLSSTEATFLNGVVRDCEMSVGYNLTGPQLDWLKDLEKIYLLKTKRKAAARKQPRDPVPMDVLDDLGLGAKAGTFKGDDAPRKPKNRNTYQRTHTQARDVDTDDYRTRKRIVDDIPDARDDVHTQGNSAWAARKVDLDFDDDIPF